MEHSTPVYCPKCGGSAARVDSDGDADAWRCRDEECAHRWQTENGVRVPPARM